jgi:3-hydroxybutyryl-CoA dehydrogenase
MTLTQADAIVERVGRPWFIEAVRMLEAGEGTVASIDVALLEVGYPAGPLRRLDEVGLDHDLAVTRALRDAHPTTLRFDAPPLQERLVDEGRLGRVTGRGFYRYAEGAAAVTDVEVELVAPMSAAAIVERLELGVINEAYRAVEDGLATPPLIDAAMRDVAGHPLGPFEQVDGLGLRPVIDRLRAIHAVTEVRSGDQYLVATALWQMATV